MFKTIWEKYKAIPKQTRIITALTLMTYSSIFIFIIFNIFSFYVMVSTLLGRKYYKK